jgi:hypothetical protein
MTLIVNLSPLEEARLCTAARRQGIAPEELARQLIARLPKADLEDRETEDVARHRGLDELVAEAQKLGMY